jgi:tRNA G18 (ribose-2'-O)-methylase SpoU
MAREIAVRRSDRSHTEAGAADGPFVVLDNIRSAWNVGSILRTCEGAGVRHLFLCGISAAPPNPRVLKTSLGAERTVPWSHDPATMQVIRKLRSEGAAIFAVELTDRSVDYTTIDYPRDCAFVFGHETYGVAAPVLQAADRLIEVPMAGTKNSLNVAVSVGVVLFEALRRRRTGP